MPQRPILPPSSLSPPASYRSPLAAEASANIVQPIGDTEAKGGGRRSIGFLIVYAMATAGGVIGYLPLLTLLLPARIEAIAGDGPLGLLTVTVVAGAIAASISNIAFGWLSDRAMSRGEGRRGWAASGLLAVALSYALIAAATSPVAIVLAIISFQIAINALLAPLLAIMADEVPAAQRGLVGGMMALDKPVAAAVSAMLLDSVSLGDALRFTFVPLLAAMFVGPLLLTRAWPATGAAASRDLAPETDPGIPDVRGRRRRDLIIAGCGRLLVQIAVSVLFYFLLYVFESVAPADAPADVAERLSHILTIAYIVPVPIAILIGRLSDRAGRRKPFLLGAAATAAFGLIVMALTSEWAGAVMGFCVFAAGSSVFLSLHAALTMQLLPSARQRGRDLGLINLANTVPALIGPALAWWLATPQDFDAVLLTLAGLALGGGLITIATSGRHL